MTDDAQEAGTTLLDFTAELKKRKSRTDQGSMQQMPDTMAKTEFLEFTQKEISKMPTFFKKEFRLKGGTVAHIRQKENGSYEIRYRRNGMNISKSAKTLEVAKERFIEALCNAKSNETSSRIFFGQYATQWLEVVKKPQVKENTLEDYRFTLRKYVFPRFGKMRLRDIKPIDVQRLLNDLESKGVRRGSEGVYVLLRAIFEFAVAENLIPKSPMTLIRKPKHETKHGQAFTIEEERILIDRCMDSASYCRYAFILMLFTGIRRSELPTAEVSPQWVTVTSSKTRKGVCKKKNVPKQELEDLVIKSTLNHVLRSDIIEDLTVQLLKIQEENRNTAEVEVIKQQLTEVNSFIKNILTAIKKGVITESTREELERLEAERVELEKKKALAEYDESTVLTRERIQFWFEQFANFDINDEGARQYLVTYFINRIILYDDRMIIIYNHDGDNRTELDTSEIEGAFGFESLSPTTKAGKNTNFCPLLFYFR